MLTSQEIKTHEKKDIHKKMPSQKINKTFFKLILTHDKEYINQNYNIY